MQGIYQPDMRIYFGMENFLIKLTKEQLLTNLGEISNCVFLSNRKK